jgi:mono/diheme cytochrome c family protein
MKNYFKLGLLVLAVSLYSCGGGEEATEEKKEEKVVVNPNNSASESKSDETEEVDEVPASKRIALENKGVGPIKSVTISETIDQVMADKGQVVYEANCTACHKPDKKFIGPAPKGILDRRSPEWVMNMIINPEVMLQEDPLAKDLLIEFNGSLMSNQGISEEDARAILEYMRTI